jgi:hypothetical protein
VDRFRHSHSERQILFVTTHLRSFTLRAAFVSVGQAFLLGSVQSHFLDQYALSFVAFASPAKANHHGGKSAVPSGPSGKSGVPSGQVNQMIEIGTGEAKLSLALLEKEITAHQLLSAIGAFRLPHEVEHDQVLRFWRLLIG